MSIKVIDSINDIKESDWNKLVHENDPFNQYHFFKALEDSGSIGAERGIKPQYILSFQDNELKAAMVLFSKMHSYGEYIFDWAWADFFQRNAKSYYPKLVSQHPYSPVTNRTFISMCSKSTNELLTYLSDVSKDSLYSSTHLLFLESTELEIIPISFKIRHSFQYHWKNENYDSFSHYLETFKTKKKKQILKERNTELHIRNISCEELGKYTDEFYELYLSTVDKKGAHAYLNRSFFASIFKNMPQQLLLIGAFKDERLVAASLFFKGREKLYGRYWGCLDMYSNLHFELCYYQGIDYCIKNKIDIFEAGAQGEHKIQRGFKPVLTYSAHFINDDTLAKPIYHFVDEEKEQTKFYIQELSKKLPFKKIT
ncbi:peptidogalycan biosysnthesis protein [Halobacteriovorax sp. HLS]|uniref:peptidogalycan biosysnthesis protein n=1 Tax=Halobacteriovorax sp. HLS TaxID=2234000 RepID=UPI000FDA9BAA|nr:peptidogalycan biosysnthesis protein [Halobacteriovorax sp. HLS]